MGEFIRKNGTAEALEQTKKEGKVRFVGFTGHMARFQREIHRCRLIDGQSYIV